ncbi:MAG: MBL fold metallo-hydrolase [Mogibacterium sp.]|nr:MBL fold metallo-hydrolase [Mogibacterium sp.]
MKITWIGHSCFKIEEDGYSLILDPYEDGSVPGLSDMRETANEVHCSHDHFDHNAVQTVTIEPKEKSPFKITKMMTYHDDEKGAKRGMNFIHVIETDREKIVHLGDLGCEPEPEQMEAIAGCDVLMIPVGGYYTIDARQAALLTMQLEPRFTIPMHYRSAENHYGFDVLGTVYDFAAYFTNVWIKSESFMDTTDPTPAKVVVLQAQNQASEMDIPDRSIFR